MQEMKVAKKSFFRETWREALTSDDQDEVQYLSDYMRSLR